MRPARRSHIMVAEERIARSQIRAVCVVFAIEMCLVEKSFVVERF